MELSKEFCLSDKIEYYEGIKLDDRILENWVYDVKQSIQKFLKELKEDFNNIDLIPIMIREDFLRFIDTLAKAKFGEKLI